MGKKYRTVCRTTVMRSERKSVVGEVQKRFSGDSYALEHIHDTEPDSVEVREEFVCCTIKVTAYNFI